MTKYSRGSEWRKWDLHVHTPLSICQHFWWESPEIWEKYIKDLESLPAEFKVLWINDYLFLDGYKHLLDEKTKNGRLKNIDLLLPVIEFRIEKFAWVEFGNLKRINFHVIFSDEISIETLQSQFLNTLEQSYSLGDGRKWTRAITRDSLSELWAQIKSGVPADELDRYGSDLEEWFNNLNIDEKWIFNALNKDCFEWKYLTAIWKTEWDQLKWTDSSIATKKSIISQAHIVFTSSESIAVFAQAKAKLKAQNVNDLLLDCSDAHSFSDSANKDRIGKCFTWIKANPTFDGLRQIIYEPQDRVFVWESPEVLDRVRTNKTKYIKSLKIDHASWYDGKKWIWFKDVNIAFNKELVVVIWNKGNWKSAIADILGLLGNTRNHENFSFLDKHRFHKEGLSKNFEGFLEWENLTVDERILYDGVIWPTSPEKVRYLPQDFFNKLTNDLSGKNFKATLENVIFQHLDPSLRMWKDTFEELKELKTQTIKEEIEKKKAELADLNSRIVKLERKQLPEYLDRIDNAIKQKETELQEKEKLLEELKAKEVKNPNEDAESKRLKSESFGKIEELNSLLSKINNLIDEKRELKWRLEIEKESLTVFLANFEGLENKFSQYKDANRERLLEFGIKVDEVIKLTVNNQPLKDKLQNVNSELEKIRKLFLTKEDISLMDWQLAPQLESESLTVRKENCLNDIEVIKKDLSKHEKEYQEYLEQKNIIEKSLQDIRWSSDKAETLEYYKNLKKYVSEGLPLDLLALEDQRLSVALSIFSEKKKIIDLFNSFKNPIDKKVEANKAYLDDDYAINIDAKLDFDPSIDRRFLGYINQAKKGSFCWLSEWTTVLWNIYLGTNPHVDDSIKEMLIGFLEHIRFDKRDGLENEPRNIFDQVADVEAFYNYIYSLDYLKPEYELKSWEKALEELSPWEKWTLLLIFYLMIDEEWIPLIIDQPEDNLDNQSVFKMLTRFIKIAKKQRQIVIVTHNPNLAIWADAEQIIYVKIDKKGNNAFSFKSWSIEDPEINKITVDILEWTMPAFDKRRLKYIKSA